MFARSQLTSLGFTETSKPCTESYMMILYWTTYRDNRRTAKKPQISLINNHITEEMQIEIT